MESLRSNQDCESIKKNFSIDAHLLEYGLIISSINKSIEFFKSEGIEISCLPPRL